MRWPSSEKIHCAIRSFGVRLQEQLNGQDSWSKGAKWTELNETDGKQNDK